MIKFFRHIRLDLMENPPSAKASAGTKTGKYLKYAVGEIVLVVLGILIALSINNWNENRKNISKKEILLNAIYKEFAANLNQMDTVLYYDNLVLKSILRFMKLDPENSADMTNDSMSIWYQNSSFRWTFNPLNGALRSGISSGEIHLIKNDSLSNLLFGWEDFVTDAKEGEARTITAVKASKAISEKYIRSAEYRTAYLPPELAKSRFPSDYKSLFRDPLFEDYLAERYMSMNETINELNLVKKKNSLVLKLINMELDKS